MVIKIAIIFSTLVLAAYYPPSYAIAPGAGQAQMQNNMQQMQQNKQRMQEQRKMQQQYDQQNKQQKKQNQQW